MKTIFVDAWQTLVTADGMDQKMYEILEKFENLKVIVTNADEENQKKYGIVNMPYEVYTLKNDPNKSDPKYYQMLMEDYNLSPDEVVLFENVPESVESAKKAGIKNVYRFDPEVRDYEALEKFIQENL